MKVRSDQLQKLLVLVLIWLIPFFVNLREILQQKGPNQNHLTTLLVTLFPLMFHFFHFRWLFSEKIVSNLSQTSRRYAF